MQVLCKAVGKYKDKFNQTGLLLVVDGQDRWCDFPGQLNWKDYKDKVVDVDMSQNEKGYWHGAFMGQALQGQTPNYQPPDQGHTPPPQSAGATKSQPDWDAIAEGKTRCAVVCAAIQSGQMSCTTPEEALEHVRLIMTGEPAPF